VLVTLSQRARLLRQQQGLTLRSLADKSGLFAAIPDGRRSRTRKHLRPPPGGTRAALQTTAADLITQHSEDPMPA
jgi:transcriptional regulator with XRE-family HTH domain